MRAALAELDLAPPADPEVRERLATELQQDGQEALYARLTELEPDVAATIAAADSRRTLRALEGIEQGRSAAGRSENRLWTTDTRVPTEIFALVMQREALYARIETRIDEMIALGAEAEVRGAEPLAGRTARQALGFDELLAGDVDKLKTNTRRYAKRQLTWLRKLPDAQLLDVGELTPGRSMPRLRLRSVSRFSTSNAERTSRLFGFFRTPGLPGIRST